MTKDQILGTAPLGSAVPCCFSLGPGLSVMGVVGRAKWRRGWSPRASEGNAVGVTCWRPLPVGSVPNSPFSL